MCVPKSVPRRASRRRGFTLIEVLVGLLIFSLGVLGLVGLQARAVQLSVQSSDRARAAVLANEIVALMWAQKTTSPDSASVAAWQTRVAAVTSSGLPNGSGTVATSTDGTGITTATVTISWHPPALAMSSPDNRYVTTVVMP